MATIVLGVGPPKVPALGASPNARTWPAPSTSQYPRPEGVGAPATTFAPREVEVDPRFATPSLKTRPSAATSWYPSSLAVVRGAEAVVMARSLVRAAAAIRTPTGNSSEPAHQAATPMSRPILMILPFRFNRGEDSPEILALGRFSALLADRRRSESKTEAVTTEGWSDAPGGVVSARPGKRSGALVRHRDVSGPDFAEFYESARHRCLSAVGDPHGLQQALRADGLNATVWYGTQPCTYTPAGLRDGVKAFTQRSDPAALDVVDIHPAALLPGTSLFISVDTQPAKLAGQPTVMIQVVQGSNPQCISPGPKPVPPQPGGPTKGA